AQHPAQPAAQLPLPTAPEAPQPLWPDASEPEPRHSRSEVLLSSPGHAIDHAVDQQVAEDDEIAEEDDQAFEAEAAELRELPAFAAAPPACSAEPAAPELIPVSASVFDDDFFRTERVRARVADTLLNATQLPRLDPHDPSPRDPHSWDPDDIIIGSGARTPAVHGYATAGPVVRGYAPAPPSTGALYAGASGSGSAIGEGDELDIPAFLRRSR
ncbi:MAG: hypothetical protein M3O02_00120, partial [Acidobacteriota bacterium]|nr:hypothetical protein [Acidobacteriota bacterium]